jgi:DNA-binding transcriptional LysR family regulator
VVKRRPKRNPLLVRNVATFMAGEHWFGIELRHLAALEAVAREGSFRRAAERLGYVQSAISHQIAALETLTGRRLIERSRGTRPIALTPAGEVLLAHADAVIARMRAAQADLAALEGEGTMTLRVGSMQDVTARLIPALLRGYARLRPDVVVTLHESESPNALLAALVQGDVDLAFVELPLPPGAFDGVPLFEDPYVALVQAGTPLARRGSIALTAIAELPLVAHSPTRTRVEAHLRARGVEPRFVLQSEASATVQAFVGAGLGAAIVPRLAVDDADHDTVVLELDPPIAPRSLALAWNGERRLRKDAASFADAARAVCAELGFVKIRDRSSDASRLLCA